MTSRWLRSRATSATTSPMHLRSRPTRPPRPVRISHPERTEDGAEGAPWRSAHNGVRSILARQNRLEHLARGALEHADLVRIALEHGLGEMLGLLQADMRRQRRHLRIGL